MNVFIDMAGILGLAAAGSILGLSAGFGLAQVGVPVGYGGLAALWLLGTVMGAALGFVPRSSRRGS